MGNIKTNEREVASTIAMWIEDHIQTGGGYPFTEAKVEPGIKVAGKTLFGDIVIWKNREAKEAFSYIEIKPPFGNKENLDTFRKKALQLKVKYAFIWDFQNLNVYKVEDTVKPHDSFSYPILNNIDEWLQGDKQVEIKKFIRWFCDELEKLNQTGKLSRFSPDKIYFINLIRETKDKLIPSFERFIKDKQSVKENRSKIDKYVIEQGISMPNEQAYYKMIASQRVYGLITKIIFYLTIRRYFKDLPDLTDTDEADLNRTIKVAFAKASEKDWQAVFLEDPIEELGIPDDAVLYLKEFFKELRVYHFVNLKEDVIGELFEEIIDPKDRHSLGQYFTREDLVDFVIATVVKDYEGIYADPTCGSGTFLIRLYDRLRYLRPQMKHNELLQQIWGIDIGKFPAELSTINLFRQEPQNFENFPRILNKNIFSISHNFITEFPPPHAGKEYKKIKIKIPEFNGFVGNFPYIRQELIEKKERGFKDELTLLLAEEYLFTYPVLFELKKEAQVALSSMKEFSPEKRSKRLWEWIEMKKLQLKLSGQADIYAYIFIHAATLLAKQGKFGIITSNSWLDTAYGSILKQFFLDNFHIRMVVASWAEPWFDDAAVNTIVTVLEKKVSDLSNNDEPVRFVKLKKKFEELVPYRDFTLESVKRWQRFDALVREIETAGNNRKCRKITSDLKTYETGELRVRLVSQHELQKEVNEKGESSKWGKYLRAPDVYFELLEECKDKLVPLKNIADVRFGVKTGINEFFYLEPLRIFIDGEKIEFNKVKEPLEIYLTPDTLVYCRNLKGYEFTVESKFLRKIVKSPREISSIKINPEELMYFIFICDKSKEELGKSGDKYALEYIEWGEKQKTKEGQNTSVGIDWTDVPSVQGRTYWYDINVNNFSDFMWPKSFNERYFIAQNKDCLIADRLYELTIKKKKPKKEYRECLTSILNSSIQFLFIEANGRMNLGEGALDNMKYEAEECLIVNPDIKLDFPNRKILLRKTKSIFEEVKQKDRKELDIAVLEALGLNAKEWLPKIYTGLCEMVKERLELPKMRKKQIKDKVIFAYHEVKESVEKDIMPAGSERNFPQRFLTDGLAYDTLKLEQLNKSGTSWKIEPFMGQYQLIDDSGNVIMESTSETRTKFLYIALYNSTGNTYSITVPVDENICKSILNNYLEYVNTFLKMLVANASMKLHDISLAEKMAKEIADEKHLIYNFESKG